MKIITHFKIGESVWVVDFKFIRSAYVEQRTIRDIVAIPNPKEVSESFVCAKFKNSIVNINRVFKSKAEAEALRDVMNGPDYKWVEGEE